MKLNNTALGWLSLVLIISLCQPGTANADNPRTKTQAANFFYLDPTLPLDPFPYAPGAATLMRTKNSLWASIAASGLDADSAYTVWWVIWNKPSNCNGACGDEDADFGVPGNGVFFAGGFVTGADGTANVMVKLNSGRLPRGTDVVIPGQLNRWRGLKAEVHLVLRTHGPIVPGDVAEQISTYFGLCGDPISVLAAPPCFDQQAAVFLP